MPACLFFPPLSDLNALMKLQRLKKRSRNGLSLLFFSSYSSITVYAAFPDHAPPPLSLSGWMYIPVQPARPAPPSYKMKLFLFNYWVSPARCPFSPPHSKCFTHLDRGAKCFFTLPRGHYYRPLRRVSPHSMTSGIFTWNGSPLFCERDRETNETPSPPPRQIDTCRSDDGTRDSPPPKRVFPLSPLSISHFSA